MKAGLTTSLHFPAAPDTTPAKSAAPESAPNVLESFRDALSESDLIHKRLRSLLVSADRHGDLQVILSACLRLERPVRALIQSEEV